MKDATFRSGFVAIVGRPNVGKSTLMNSLVQRKLAIVSDKPQTTRHRISGVVNLPAAQIVFFDTPGLHKPRDPLGNRLNATVCATLADVDVILFLVDAAAGIGAGDRFVAAELRRLSTPKVVCLNKIDVTSCAQVVEQFTLASALAVSNTIFPISALDRDGVEPVLEAIKGYMPEGPMYYPEGMITDQPEKLLMAELVREQVFIQTREEVPYAIAVIVDEVTPAAKGLVKVFAHIYVERESQKGIIVGAGGSALKGVGTEARLAMERLFGNRIYLDLRVKVKKGWRADESTISQLGY